MSSPMIPASELAALQAAVNASLDTPCLVQRKSPVKDGYGSASDGFATTTTTTCAITQPSLQVMQNYAYLIGNLASWQVRLPVGTDVRRDDQLIVGSGATQQTVRVQAVLDLKSRALGLHVLASEIR